MDEVDPSTPVGNEEVLFRSVPIGRGWVKLIDGVCKPSSQAFNDKDDQPSVDRSELLAGDPQRAKMSDTDGVLQMIAGDVRQITVVRTDRHPGNPPTEIKLTVDVKPDPLPNRPSHAVVKFDPIPGGSSNFSKLKERLARLATWAPGAEIELCQ